MMILGNNVSSDGQRTLTLRLSLARRLWPFWHYDGPKALIHLIGYDIRGSVSATRFTVRELAAIRQAEEVLRCPSPLLFAGLLEQLSELTPLRWRCGREVDVEKVVEGIRGRAILS